MRFYLDSPRAALELSEAIRSILSNRKFEQTGGFSQQIAIKTLIPSNSYRMPLPAPVFGLPHILSLWDTTSHSHIEWFMSITADRCKQSRRDMLRKIEAADRTISDGTPDWKKTAGQSLIITEEIIEASADRNFLFLLDSDM
jgi:hypothetical protein